jgi:hypothetical protein
MPNALWESTGARSLEHWVAWKCGMSNAHAKELVTTARRRDELPETMAGMAEGVISEDQVAVIARKAPEGMDRHFASLARDASVSQLQTALRIARRAQPPVPAPPRRRRRTSRPLPRSSRRWTAPCRPGPTTSVPGTPGSSSRSRRAPTPTRPWPPTRTRWSRSGRRPGTAAKDAGVEELHPAAVPHHGRCLPAPVRAGPRRRRPRRPHCDRTTVILHLDVESQLGELHLGPALTDAERRYLCCDATFETWFERDGEVIGAARASRKIPRRLRRALERRDRCCRVPGCGATAGLHAHHIIHWEDGGPTELWNLVLVCPFHHRLHHRGGSPSGVPAAELEVIDRRDRLLSGGSLARPPGEPFPDAPRYRHVPGERAQWKWYDPPGCGRRTEPSCVSRVIRLTACPRCPSETSATTVGRSSNAPSGVSV